MKRELKRKIIVEKRCLSFRRWKGDGEKVAGGGCGWTDHQSSCCSCRHSYCVFTFSFNAVADDDGSHPFHALRQSRGKTINNNEKVRVGIGFINKLKVDIFLQEREGVRLGLFFKERTRETEQGLLVLFGWKARITTLWCRGWNRNGTYEL